ncbi:MAG: hypothetical protein N2444_03950 [Methylocystis sp.]|nr:hypothetical protein [Methylocystis sp.]
MFVVSSTAYGINQRLLAYAQMIAALAHAETAPATPTDRSQIYQAPSAADTRDAVAIVGAGKGVYVGVVGPPQAAPEPPPPGDAAKAQIVKAMMNERLGGSR